MKKITYLSTVPDHPATLLAQQNQKIASATLAAYERKHGVVFAALDVETLAALREIAEEDVHADNPIEKDEPLEEYVRRIGVLETARLHEMIALVTDLLGLED